MKLGVFGGTFDPPHLGHLVLAAEAYHQLGLDRLLWVLTPDPPHKEGEPITPLHDRLDMLLAAIQDNPDFELSRVEMDRPGPHYAVDTVQLLRARYPGADLIYLMGGDSLRDLPTWHKPRRLLTICDHLGVMPRPGDKIDLVSLETLLPGVTTKILFIEAPLLDIAASDIRQRVHQGRPFRYFVAAAVYQVIQERGLYR